MSKSLSYFLKFSYGGFVSAIVSFLSTPLITAIVLPEEFGKASMMILTYSLLINFVQLGSDQSFVRFFYQKKYVDNKSLLLSNSIIIPVTLSLFISIPILYFGKNISLLLIDKFNFQVPILLILLIVFGVIERFSTLIIRMEQKGSLFSNLKIIQSLINILIIVLYANFIESSFLAIVYGNLFSLLVVTTIGVCVERKYWSRIINKLNRIDIVEIISYGLPFVPAFLISWIFEGIDKIALKYFTNFGEIGIYTAAYKIVAALTILQTTFSNFWVPISYEAYEKDSNESKELFQNVFNGISGFFFLFSILIISFKDLIINFFSEDYESAANIVPFLVFMPIMYTLSEITVGGINFMKKTYWHFIISFISAAVNILSVYILVPNFGGIGAAISTSFAFISFFFLRTFISNYYYPLNFKLHKTVYAIIIVFFVAYINTFYFNKEFLFIINCICLIVMFLNYKNELRIVVFRYFKN